MARHDHDHGLHHDLERMLGRPLSRRRVFRWMAGAAAGAAVLPALGCDPLEISTMKAGNPAFSDPRPYVTHDPIEGRPCRG